MSLALIEESAKEVRRLAIAGGPLAVGDFRLKKLIAPLEQAGAKVPVFAQVAKSISDVVNGTEAESASRLLALSTLLNAILYTQGKTGADGDFQRLESFPANCAATRTTARALKPLTAALTTSGGGRLDTIKTAVERGAFNDLRLIAPAIQALGDNSPEIADLVAEKLLPAFGPGIIPQLKVDLDLKGRKHDARKLSVMHRLDPAGTVSLCQTALDDGSVEVKIAAVACLGQHEDYLPLVLEQSNSKNKAVRAATLEALAPHDRPEIAKLFTELVKGKDLDILARPFRALRNREVLNSLIEQGRRVFEAVLKNDAEQIARFGDVVKCLATRKEAEVEHFLMDCMGKSEALNKIKAAPNSTVTGKDLVEQICLTLYGKGSPKALGAILARRESLPDAMFCYVVDCALRVWSSERVFEEFSPLLATKGNASKSRREVLERAVHITHERSNITQSLPKHIAWDPRWLDAGIKADSRMIVCCLARAGHKPSLDYLLKLGDTKESFHADLTIRALVRCEYPGVTDFLLEQFSWRIKTAKYLDPELQTLLASAQFLPKSDLPKLDAYAAGMDEKFVDEFLEAIAPLRAGVPQQWNPSQK